MKRKGEQMPRSSTRCQTVAVMLNCRRVVLEGRKVCRSVTASSCWDVGTVAVKISGRSAGGQIFWPDGVKFFYQWSNFLTGSQIFLPPHQTPQNALKWPYKANLHHFIYTSRKPFHFLSSFYNIFIYYISSSFLLIIINIYKL